MCFVLMMKNLVLLYVIHSFHRLYLLVQFWAIVGAHSDGMLYFVAQNWHANFLEVHSGCSDRLIEVVICLS